MTKPKKTRNRRTKASIDPKIFATLVAVVRVGAGKKEAAAQAGIAESTIHSYLERGRAALKIEPSKRTEEESAFADFQADIAKAENHVRVYCLGMIQKAVAGDWKAGAWLLEKLYPSLYGRHVVSLEHSGSIDTKRDFSKLTTEELFALQKLASKIEGDDDV